MSPAELGNLLESLPPAKRSVVWGLVDPEDDGEVLAERRRLGPEVDDDVEQRTPVHRTIYVSANGGRW